MKGNIWEEVMTCRHATKDLHVLW